MAIVEGWLPPTREHYDTIMLFWQFVYPLFSSAQWFTTWYPMGKTSSPSIFNIPGRIAWLTMELPGPLTFAYTMRALLSSSASDSMSATSTSFASQFLGGSGSPSGSGWADLPWQNQTLAGLFILHYSYRALLYPLLQPSIAPIHIVVWFSAILFHLCNATCLASWLASYGPVSPSDWSPSPPSSSSPSPPFFTHLSTTSTPRFVLGVLIFAAGLSGSFFHDDVLRRIRRPHPSHSTPAQSQYQMQTRSKTRKQTTTQQQAQAQKYAVPQAGLFQLVLFPHYLCEWIEWLGFWIAAAAAGRGCAPARVFLQNEVLAMLPRAVSGRRWYAARFGEEKLRGRRAIIPGLI